MTTRHSTTHLRRPAPAPALRRLLAAPAPQAPQDSTKFTVENTERFAALDPAAEAAVSCTGLQERTLGDGRLEVVANVKNSGDEPVTVKVQCVFLRTTRGRPRWPAPVAAPGARGGSTEVVRFTAPNAAAKRYAIRVRTARAGLTSSAGVGSAGNVTRLRGLVHLLHRRRRGRPCRPRCP
jgi:hypothetical protein